MENNATPSSIPDPDLSPENSPVGPGRAQVGTRRINNTPMVIVFVLMVLFLFVVIAVMYSRSKRQIAQNTEQHTSASKQADSIIPKQLAWTQAPVAPTPPPNLAPMIQAVVPPPAPTEPPVDPVNNARLQALQTALSAKPNVEGVTLAKTTAATATGSAGENDPEARKLALLRGILARDQENKGAGDAGSTIPQADFTGLSPFDAANPHRWQTSAQIENPSSFVLRTGSVIPGVLISGVNSELPGTIIAQVSQNVYDTPTGQYLLFHKAAA